jgi:MinD superfamily P-loop ATPase
MVITVASGKGGTGKTTIASNLAKSIEGIYSQPDAKQSVWVLDCDVEAPNAALFLKPAFDTSKTVERLFPQINSEKCTGCGRCAEVCVYNALAVVNKQVIFFKELCHACGSCALNCPENAISEHAEVVGTLEKGASSNLGVAQGTLTIGFSSPVPVIRDLKKWILPGLNSKIPVIIDASPGTACPVVEALRGSDFALLVTEPTPFGLHDLRLICQLVQEEFNLPCGVVINKSGNTDQMIEDFCQEKQIPVLMRIPLSKDIAVAYSHGQMLIDYLPEYKEKFIQLHQRIEKIYAEGAQSQ